MKHSPKKCPACQSSRYNGKVCKRCNFTNLENKEVILYKDINTSG